MAAINFAKKTCLFSFTIIYLIIIACASDKPEDLVLQGWWEQEGYGNIYEVSDEEIIIYNTCKSGCIVANEVPIEALSDKYSLVNDSIYLIDGINQYRFKKIHNTEHICSNVDESKQNDPLYNFDFLWDTFNENYCYFKEREIDWNQLRKKYRPRLNENSSQLELYTVLLEMTEELGDGHVGISADDDIEEAFEENTVEEDEGPGTLEFISLAKEIADANLDNVSSYHNGIVNWGEINDSILYLQINTMLLMADYTLSDTLDMMPFIQSYFEIADEKIDHDDNEVNGIRSLLDKIVSNKKYKACILDVRFNGGGHDEVALEIMSFLTPSPYAIGEKKAFYKGKWGKPVKINQHKSNSSIDGSLIVLTSHKTASASEILTMSALAHPNATIIGSTTEGVFSDMLDKVLPNEWDFSLSNEVYLDHEGKNHEAIGISPEIILDYDIDDTKFYNSLIPDGKSQDEAILKALAIINKIHQN